MSKAKMGNTYGFKKGHKINTGRKHTVEHIKKQRKAKLGKPRAGNPENWKHTQETKDIMRDIKKGGKHTERHKENQRKAQIKRWENPKERKKMSEKMKGRKITWKKKIGQANSIALKGNKLSEKTKEKIRKGVTKHGLSYTKEYKRFNCSKRRARLRNAQGDLTFEKWEEIKKKYNYTCLACKKREPEIILSVDHIIPLIKGGKNSCDNVQPLCIICNKIKYTKVTDFRNLNNI